MTIEYDGTAYAGWQVQVNAVTVQGVVETALGQVMHQPVRIYSAGRTDAGVHARGMTAHFQTTSNLPLQAFREGVNRFLPSDVAIREVREMPTDFHARFAARGKWYRYTIYNHQIRSPLNARTAWHLRGALDLVLMRRAAGCLIGVHDFRAFRSSGCVARTTLREIFQVDILAEGAFVRIDVRGTGFLRHMVRMLVGTLVEIGQGRRPVEDLARLLQGETGLVRGPTAPAHGLCLQAVWYDSPVRAVDSDDYP